MDIVPDNRIVYAYDMHLNQTRISASLATVELTPAGAGTRLVYTEQGAFLDGLDTPAAPARHQRFARRARRRTGPPNREHVTRGTTGERSR